MNNKYSQAKQHNEILRTMIKIIIIIGLVIFYLIWLYSRRFIPSYENGTVIAVNEPDNVEVKLDNGVRVFIEDINDINYNDIQYGDTVKLEFVNKKYKVLEVIE